MTYDEISKNISQGSFELVNLCLHLACFNENKEVVQFLLKSGADIKSMHNGQTLLHTAVQSKNVNILDIVLRAGANIDAQGQFSQTKSRNYHNTMDGTALHLAALLGYKDMVEHLLQCGAYVNASNTIGNCPIHCAAEREHQPVIHILLKNGAGIEARNIFGYTPLHHAVASGSKSNFAIFLIGLGANKSSVNLRGETLFHTAVLNVNRDVASWLVASGVSLSVKTFSNRTAVEIAWSMFRHESVKLLLDLGLSPHVELFLGSPLLYSALGTPGRSEVLEHIFKLYPEMINTFSYTDNKTILHTAVEIGEPNVIQLVLKHSPDVEAQDMFGDRALHFAAKKGNHEKISLLLDAGADIDAPGANGCTALFQSATLGRSHILKSLISKGANLDAQCSDSKSPLMEATHLGHVNIIKALLNAGANVNARGPDQITVLHIAVAMDIPDLVRLLLRYGANMSSVGWMENALVTPFQAACSKSALQSVTELVKLGAIPDVEKSLNSDLKSAVEEGLRLREAMRGKYEYQLNKPILSSLFCLIFQPCLTCLSG